MIQNARPMNPAARAIADLSSFAHTKLRLFSAKRGRQAWPSCDMELANSTGNGSIPEANIVTNMMCGPDCGIRPMRTAMKIIIQVLPFIHDSMSMYIDRIPTASSTPKVQAKIDGRCLRMTWCQMCSFRK